MKGCLLKRNWFTAEQERFFELYGDGELRYYKGHQGDYRGSIYFNKDTKVEINAQQGIDAAEMAITCETRNKTFVLVQPQFNEKRLVSEIAKGHECKIHGWATALQDPINILNQEGTNIVLASLAYVPKTKGNSTGPKPFRKIQEGAAGIEVLEEEKAQVDIEDVEVEVDITAATYTEPPRIEARLARIEFKEEKPCVPIDHSDQE